jgi:hypothetical protein
MDTKIVFVGGADIRVRQELEEVKNLLTGERNLTKFELPGTEARAIFVNPVSIAYIEEVPEV